MRRNLKAVAILGALAMTATTGAVIVFAAEHEQTIYMSAIEPKGTTNVEKEPFPEEALPEGGGYALKEPNEDGDWVVETYVWLPGEVTVREGDEVNLQILGVNGSLHTAFIEGYDEQFEVTRGALTEVAFTADQPGVFRIVCTIHQPSMTGRLIVLPAEA